VIPVANCDEDDRLPDDRDQGLARMPRAEDRTSTKSPRRSASGIAAAIAVTHATDGTRHRC
jgi:hypothetical protein